MGKWSPNYTDNELSTKISTLVTGALRRAAVDNDANVLGHMTYENFVKDLDAGDSFTATMLDILVKEYAERRLRPNGDRRYISPRTIKSLRQLSTPLNQYHTRVRGTRRPIASILPDFDEEDDFGSLVDEAAEGGMAPGSASLADAMPGPWYPRSGGLDDFPSRSGVQLRVRSPPDVSTIGASGSGSGANAATAAAAGSSAGPSRTSPASWAVLPAPTTVTRQASIRRPFMSTRNIEFNNFTRRHRSTHREGLEGDGDVTVTEPRDEPWTTRTTSATGARRFFPNLQARRARTSLQRLSVPMSDGTSSDEGDLLWQSSGDGMFPEQFLTFWGNGSIGNAPRAVRTSPTGNAVAGPSPAASAPLGASPSTSASGSGVISPPETVAPSALSLGPREGEVPAVQVTVAAPRLRRGGVRAPEAMVVRGEPATPAAATVETLFSGPLDAPTEVVDMGLGGGETLFDAPAAYPTPGSTAEGEHLT